MSIHVMSNPVGKAKVTVGSSSTAVLAANNYRTYALIQADDSNTENIFLGFAGAAVANTGMALPPGAAFEIDNRNLSKADINGICASGGQTVYVLEA